MEELDEVGSVGELDEEDEEHQDADDALIAFASMFDCNDDEVYSIAFRRAQCAMRRISAPLLDRSTFRAMVLRLHGAPPSAWSLPLATALQDAVERWLVSLLEDSVLTAVSPPWDARCCTTHSDVRAALVASAVRRTPRAATLAAGLKLAEGEGTYTNAFDVPDLSPPQKSENGLKRSAMRAKEDRVDVVEEAPPPEDNHDVGETATAVIADFRESDIGACESLARDLLVLHGAAGHSQHPRSHTSRGYFSSSRGRTSRPPFDACVTCDSTGVDRHDPSAR